MKNFSENDVKSVTDFARNMLKTNSGKQLFYKTIDLRLNQDKFKKIAFENEGSNLRCVMDDVDAINEFLFDKKRVKTAICKSNPISSSI